MKTMQETPERVGVLGLGLIGSIWARHLHDAGVLTAAWNRTPPADPAPTWKDSPRAVAEHARVLIVVVADPPAVESVLKAMLPALGREHLVIQSSTIGPSDSARFSNLIQATGARYLEAPFTGSKPAAEAKKTIFYLGGDAAIAQQAEPMLHHISARRIHIGTGEQACTIKLAMNLQIAALMQALGEAIHLTRHAGISDHVFFDCMKGNASWSGLAALKEPKIRAGDTTPQFSVKHLLKDLKLIDPPGGSPLPALTMMVDLLKAAVDNGWSEKDFSIIYDLIAHPGNSHLNN
jgi:3-hydroxyisobutyrate dehydrogenase-like beta-hydroxyacid dehydrogenase